VSDIQDADRSRGRAAITSSAASALLDLNQILARRAGLGRLAPEDGALVA
jgi:hypothetical protein